MKKFRIKKINNDKWTVEALLGRRWVSAKWDSSENGRIEGDSVSFKSLKAARSFIEHEWSETRDLDPCEYSVKVTARNGSMLKKSPKEPEVVEWIPSEEEVEKASKGEEKFKRTLFVCDCGDVSHQFVITRDFIDRSDPVVSAEMILNTELGFWRRLWVALRYLFKAQPSRFGPYDEVILNRSHAEPLQEVVDALRKFPPKNDFD